MSSVPDAEKSGIRPVRGTGGRSRASTRRGCTDPRRHGTKRSTRQLLTIDGRSGSTDMRDATMLSLARTAVERVKESGRCPPPKPTA